MEEARKGATPAVLKATSAVFEKKILKEHLSPQACGQLKEAWSAYIWKHFTQSSPGPSANPSNVLLDRPMGLVGVVLIENIKWLYTQTSVLCCADASQ